MKRKNIIANWKLNGNQNAVIRYIRLLNEYYVTKNKTFCEIVIAFPTIYLYLAHMLLSGKNVFLAAQNVDINITGAFTGETSVNMLQDINVSHVIIGHSERRLYHQETNLVIAHKFKKIKDANLIPILCIGENSTEQKLQKTQKVCQEQLDIILEICGPMAFQNSIVAYEPIWAIGSGKTASPVIVQKTHAFIKEYIVHCSSTTSDNVLIYYGGSVDENNVGKLLQEPDVDGVLVGNASLDFNRFKKIIDIMNMA